MNKNTKAETELRISKIYNLLISGTSRPAILRFASRTWGEISDRSVDSYIASARKLMMEDLRDDRKMALAEEIAIRKHLYCLAFQDKKYATCLQISDSIAKLLGLFDRLECAIDVVVAYGFEVSEPSDKG